MVREGNNLFIDPPKNPKKITGTRFASILGKDRWNTPFKTWCAITRVYEEPFEDNKYTIAGKTIEPIIIDYLKRTYLLDGIVTPTDIYGENYFSKTRGDFFPDDKIFGGMWDCLYATEDEEENMVIEIKTTKRAEDWVDGAPDHYALQGCLYAHNMGYKKVMMVVAILEEEDYVNPQFFKPWVGNVVIDQFDIEERYPEFEGYVQDAELWWKAHVEAGISPDIDDKADADIIKEIMTKNVQQDEKLESLINKAEELTAAKEGLEGNEYVVRYNVLSDTLSKVNTAIRTKLMEMFTGDESRVNTRGEVLQWTLSKSVGTDIDKEAMKADGVYEKYLVEKAPSYRISISKIKK